MEHHVWIIKTHFENTFIFYNRQPDTAAQGMEFWTDVFSRLVKTGLRLMKCALPGKLSKPYKLLYY